MERERWRKGRYERGGGKKKEKQKEKDRIRKCETDKQIDRVTERVKENK